MGGQRGFRRLPAGLWAWPWLLLCGLLCGLLCSAPLRAAEILLSSADEHPALHAFATELAARRPLDRVCFKPLAQLPPAGALPADTRLVLFGTQALDWRLASEQGPPTLVLRVSRVQAQARLGGAPAPGLTLLWSDPEPSRQLRLVRLLLPQARRVGVLYDRHSGFLVEELRRAAAPLGLEIRAQAWPHTQDTRPLQALLQDSDLLLGLEDGDLYNAHTAKSLLLTSYARRRALVGPSASFVRAGSLASSYSDQADWLASLVRLLEQAPESWPRSAYPEHFKVLGNRRVARALAIELADERSLQRQLAEGERP